MVERLTGPKAISANQLAKEVNVAQSTLSNWMTKARLITVPSTLSVKKTDTPDNERRRPQDWSAAEKLKVVLEAAALSETELGPFLRTRGIHEADLAEWRSVALESARAALVHGEEAKRKGSKGPEDRKRVRELTREVQRLEKELTRKEKALAEAAALLVLKKKLQALDRDEDDDETGRNEK